MSNQYITRKDKDGRRHYGIHDWRMRDDDHRPHWVRYGSGSAEIEVTANTERGWCEIHVEERGEKSTRAGWITLDRAAAESLRDYLNEKLPVKAKEAV